MGETEKRNRGEERWAVIFVKFALAEGGRLMAFATIVWGVVYVLATPAIQSYMVVQLKEAPGFERLFKDEARAVGLAQDADLQDAVRINKEQQNALDGIVTAQKQMVADQNVLARSVDRLSSEMGDVKQLLSENRQLSTEILLTLKNK